ncbi:MAG: LLM class flavin-dependent oxidoreductase, partial [Actinobacteria bacterium]|nr:LLM class flavin-dependent oxidoreductase [Actinomycetota bacterium]
MKFGVFFVSETPDDDYKRAYDETLEQIEYAEHLGFDTVWLAEHHGSTYGSMPSGAVMAAAVAQRTTFIRIGLAVNILPFNNPVRMAEDYAMVDVLSNGRLDYGVGRGYQPDEFAMLGLGDRQETSREIFQESLEVITGLWTHEQFSYSGKYYTLDHAELHPRPIQKPHPPVYVAAISPETFGLIAEKGYN